MILAVVAYLVPGALLVAWSRQATFHYYRLNPEKREFYYGVGPLPRHFWQYIWTAPPAGAFVSRRNVWRIHHTEPELERARARMVFRDKVVVAAGILGWMVFLPLLNFRP